MTFSRVRSLAGRAARVVRRCISWRPFNLLAPNQRAEILIIVDESYDARLYCTKLEPEIGPEGVGKIVQKGIELLLQLGKQHGVTVSGKIG